MTTTEMKQELYNKLRDEGTYFTKSHISINRIENGYRIIIKDYEHIPFTIKEEQDEYFGYILFIKADDYIEMIDSKIGYDYHRAMLDIGYYIGTRF